MFSPRAVAVLAVFVTVSSGCTDPGSSGPGDTVRMESAKPVRLPIPMSTSTMLAPSRSSVPFALKEVISGTEAIELDVVTVSYRNGEFVPKRVDMPVGQTVRFVNESGNLVWPASNIHPTHQIYPDFDAKGPISEGESWEFTVQRAGFWRYHNHLSPAVTGIVVVEGVSAVSKPVLAIVDPGEVSFEDLEAVSVEDAIELFRDDVLLTEFVEKYGPATTVRLLSQNERRVSVDCHQRAHDMGRIAYGLFGTLAFSLSGHECHSGGYHGATEALFYDRGTTDLQSDVAALCGGSISGFFRHQCVHGIGHGLMAWTSYELPDALELCETLDGTTDRLSCHSGVFMENVVGGLAGSMGHVTEYMSDDPHFPCNVVEEKYVTSCYFYQTSRMIVLFSGDFQRVAEACRDAPSLAHSVCFQSMGRDVGGASRGQPKKAIGFCSHVGDSRHRLDCLEGAVQDSFWDLSGADNALSFCGVVQSNEEKDRCYRTIVGRAREIYRSPSGINDFCARIDEEYRKGCP